MTSIWEASCKCGGKTRVELREQAGDRVLRVGCVGVISVAPGSPAEEAGIQTEDIIVGLAGKNVDDSGKLNDILIEYRSGTSVEVEFFRGAQRRTVSVILGEQPR